MIFGRNPAAWIGVIVSCILAVLSVLTGEGVVSDALAGRLTDGLTSLADLLVILAPLITGLLIKPVVTPTAAPKLELGTPVLVEHPAGAPVDLPPPDAVVARREDVMTEADRSIIDAQYAANRAAAREARTPV